MDIIRKLSKPIHLAANKIDLPRSARNLASLREIYKLMIPASAEAELGSLNKSATTCFAPTTKTKIRDKLISAKDEIIKKR